MVIEHFSDIDARQQVAVHHTERAGQMVAAVAYRATRPERLELLDDAHWIGDVDLSEVLSHLLDAEARSHQHFVHQSVGQRFDHPLEQRAVQQR